jgi:hypothetical protein
VFLIDPSAPPLLLDEHLWSEKPRCLEEWDAVEERLRGLNFQKEVTENAVSYKLYHENFVVLADPRKADRIEFRVFNAEKPKRRIHIHKTFHLLDSWKNDLSAKFKERLSEACSLLAPQRPRAVSARKRHSYPPPAIE